MWKYIGKDECKDFLLSLHLFNAKNRDTYIKTLYSIANNIEDNYQIHKIKKRSGKLRTIYEPSKLLKEIQKNILMNILNNKSISSHAKAYQKKLSIKDNAMPHINQKIILKLDIKNFFENVSFLQVYENAFSIEYFPKSVGILLTYLCTYHDFLPQGACTSPYISNLVMRNFDNAVSSFCNENNINYTRYSDDLSFSGDFKPSVVIEKVNLELKKIGLFLNSEKTKVIKRNNSQNITGIVVNEKLQVKNSYRKRIRQEMYYIKKYGLKNHLLRTKNKQDTKEYLNSLYGRICYVLEINPLDKEFISYKENIFKIIKKNK